MKRAFVPILVMMVIGLLFAGCAKPETSATPEEPVVLKFAAPSPVQSLEYLSAGAFMDAVEERSNGRVHIDYYACPTLCAIDQVFESLQSGVADMGQVSTAYERDMLPLDSLWGLPALWDGPLEGVALYEQVYDEFYKPFYEGLHLHYLGNTIHVAAVVYTPDTPVYNREDLKGLTIRSWSETFAKIWTAFDAIPMGVSATEQYEALEKGVLDASPNIPHNITAFSIYELGNPGYVIDMGGLPSTSGTYFMNKAKYDSLPSDLQQIIDEAAHEFLTIQGAHDLTAAADDTLEFLEDYGCVIIHWSDEDKQSLREEIMLPLWDEFGAELDAEGLRGTELVERVKELASK
jgi:TRAP-type C4-dicarboxylate transport system substrate-binding protein